MTHTPTTKRGSRKMVTTGAITSRKLARVDSTAEVVYWRIYFASDKYGTMSGDPWDVLQAALPGKTGMTEDIVAQAITELVNIGLLELWCEADQSTWVHILGHDLHQQKSWMSKRGERRTPVPPSQRSKRGEYVAVADPIADTTMAIASEGSHAASGAESESSLATASAPTTTTSTTPTSTTGREERAPAAPTTLPSIIELACQQVAEATGMSDLWWVSSVQKLRHRNLSAPDTVFVDALDWVMTELDGQRIDSKRGWAMLRGAVDKGVKRHKDQPAIGTPAAADFTEMYAKLGNPGAAA